LSKFTFNFEDGTNLISSSQNSKFILANAGTKIKYDWGSSNITNNHMSSEMTIKVEKFNDSNIAN
jgi:hypothetical protein